MTKTKEPSFLRVLARLGACDEAKDWAKTQPSAEAAWAACERPDWMTWVLARVSGPPESDARKKVALMTCEIARLALREGLDPRFEKTIATVERWARGEEGVTLADVYRARNAAWDARSEAWAARDAAWRRYYTDQEAMGTTPAAAAEERAALELRAADAAAAAADADAAADAAAAAAAAADAAAAAADADAAAADADAAAAAAAAADADAAAAAAAASGHPRGSREWCDVYWEAYWRVRNTRWSERWRLARSEFREKCLGIIRKHYPEPPKAPARDGDES